MTSQEQIETAVESQNWGIASAAKRGTNPDFPYVPIIEYTVNGKPKTRNPIKGYAFATREEAVAIAQIQIDALKAAIKAQLAEPRKRALREQYGLPREMEDLSRMANPT